MERTEAIKRVAQSLLKKLSIQERKEQLEVMLYEDWSSTPEWNELSSDIKKEFENGELQSEASKTRYDSVLIIWLIDDLRAATNEYLIEELNRLSINVDKLNGEPDELIACPCCGYCTLDEPSCYDICKVCWWEDDGQDSDNADVAYGGPNYGISLTQARYNFLTTGIYDPKRKDLIELKKPKEMYKKGREFKLIEENLLIEVGTDNSWEIDIND